MYGRGHSCAAGDIRRRRGRESCPQTRRMPPPGRARTRPRGMSPSVSVAGPEMVERGRRSERCGGGKAAVRQGGDRARRRGGEGPEACVRWGDDDAAVRRCWARAAPELTSRPPRRQFPPIPRESQEDIEVAGVPFAADGATPSRTRPNGAPWCGRQPLSVSRTRRGALSAPDLPDITQVTARNRLKMPQIPRRDL